MKKFESKYLDLNYAKQRMITYQYVIIITLLNMMIKLILLNIIINQLKSTIIMTQYKIFNIKFRNQKRLQWVKQILNNCTLQNQILIKKNLRSPKTKFNIIYVDLFVEAYYLSIKLIIKIQYIMLLHLFIIFLSFHLSLNKSYASTLMLQKHTFSKKIQIFYPHIQNPQLICSIRDVSTKHLLKWKMDQTIVITNKTQDILIFTFDYDWPTQSLQYMVIDYVIMEKTPKIVSFKINVTSFQTHLVRNDMDVNDPSVLLSYPLGFTDFKLASRFTYIIIIQEIYNMYAIHYMQKSHMHNGMEFQGMGHWVEFNIVLVRPQILQECELCVFVQNRWQKNQFIYKKPGPYPYFLGLRSISVDKSQGKFYQDDKIINFVPSNSEQYGITMFPIPNTDFIDQRRYFYKYEAKIENKNSTKTYFIISLLATLAIIIIGVLIYRFIKNEKKADEQQVAIKKATDQVQYPNKMCVVCNKSMEVKSMNDQINKKICDECQLKQSTSSEIQ